MWILDLMNTAKKLCSFCILSRQYHAMKKNVPADLEFLFGYDLQ